MIPYLGDFPTGQTIYVPFHTFDSNDPTASVTISGLAITDIEIYKNGSTTQRASDSGYTLLDTDGIDFDGITGLHGFSIDTSDNTDAGFFAAGADYWVAVSAITVDGATINFWACTFSIDNRGLLRPTTAQRTVDVTAGGTVGVDWGNVENQGTSVDLSATAINLCDTTTTNTDMVSEPPTAALIADAVLDEALSGHVTAGTLGRAVADIETDATAILADTADMQPKLGTPAADVSADIAAVKADTAAILTDTGTTLEAHLTDIKGATFSGATDSLEAIRDRGDAAWTTGAGGTPPQLLQSTTIATLASQVSFTLTAGSADDDAYNGAVAIVTDQSTSTQKAVGQISDYVGSTRTVTLASDPTIFTMAVGDTIDILAAVSNAPTAAQVRAEIDSNSTQLAAIVADTNELQTDLANGGRIDLLIDGIKAVTDVIPDSGAMTSIATSAALATVDANVDAILVDTGTTLPAQIAALNDPTAATIAAAVWNAVQSSHVTAGTFGELATEIAEILADTAELQGDWANGGRLDLLLDAIKAVTDALPDSGALTSLATAAALAVVDANVDAILVDTGTTLPASLAALNDLSAAEVNAEVLDVMNTDTFALIGQENPSATPTAIYMLRFLYKMARNRKTQTSSQFSLYADDATTVDQKATISDDTTTGDFGEIVSGP